MENDTLTSGLKGHRDTATVVFTDCVGFSARMSVDEDGTLNLLHRDHKRMRRLCEDFEGRVLKSTGDGLLMRFGSAAKAVEFAITIQNLLAERAVGRPPKDSLQHRIGIHHAEIFITEADADVLGNGVNIAARLQTEADPGGICISQTVYDKAKGALEFNARYLGPRGLKNIREMVPAYKILLRSEDELPDPLHDTALALEQNTHAVRIKKLLFYVCRNHWENDSHRLEEIIVSDLLQELIQLAPDLEQLRHCLDVAVGTLSKPAEYSIVATHITRAMVKLYSPQSPPSGPPAPIAPLVDPLPSIAPVPTDDHRPLYQKVAAELEQAANSTRIHKLLFYVCRNRWEGNPVQLSHVSMQELIAELHQLAPSLDQLQSLVDGFVQTLSKQAEYALVATTLIEVLQPLYQTHQVEPPAQPPNPLQLLEPDDVPSKEQEHHYKTISAGLKQDPNNLRIKKLMLYLCRRRWESDIEALKEIEINQLVREIHLLAPTIDWLESALDSIVRTLNKQAEYSIVAQVILESLKPLYQENSPAEAAEFHGSFSSPQPVFHSPLPSPVDAVHLRSSIEAEAAQIPNDPTLVTQLNTARLEILRSISSLRAKMLIFSALQNSHGSDSQPWLSLRRYDLDELLWHLVGICRTYSELETLLCSTAQRFGDAKENMQTAHTVIRCLRPVYQQREPVQLQAEATSEEELTSSISSPGSSSSPINAPGSFAGSADATIEP